ncbi:MAG: hypothetical protein ISS38_02745, partial [Candidatus Cloacimonetes bacterium]|nr:hypothetical protein [Candidatus Cloacimonadota bacterium]
MKKTSLIIFITFFTISLFGQNLTIPNEKQKDIFSFPSQFRFKNLNTSQS